MKSYIRAGQVDDQLSDMLDEIEDDFDYIISGIEKLARMGGTQAKEAKALAANLSSNLESTISQIADKF